MDGATVVIVPVLNRPHRVAPLIESLTAATPEPHRLLFVCTLGDVDEIDTIDRHGAERMVIPPNARGDYAVKINIGYRRSTEPFLFCAADDLAFHPGWLSIALAAMTDATVGVVGTNDLGNARVMAGLHSTHSLVRRSYVDRFGTVDEPGKVLHEGYPHTYCDDEFVHTARYRGAWVSAPDSVVEHLHPDWGKGDGYDQTYVLSQASMVPGRKLFNRRKHMWER